MAIVVHPLIREMAQKMAYDAYEVLALDNNFHKVYPSNKHYANCKLKTYVPLARQELAKMLANEKTPISQKDQIFEALMMDKTLPKAEMHLPSQGLRFQ